jgi:hypothetical protein
MTEVEAIGWLEAYSDVVDPKKGKTYKVLRNRK